MINDFSVIFYWWLLLFSAGLFFIPLTWFFLRDFFDFGYPFAKITAIILVSYLVWITGSLHFLPFSSTTLWLVIFPLLLGNLALAVKYKRQFLDQIKKTWQLLVFEEILFFTFLCFWSYVRGFQPNIEGLEKFMDFGFINSLLHSQYFPPADMWMAGETINYYYFGHLVAAILTKLSSLSSVVTYNLMIATIPALVFGAVFSLTTTLLSLSFLRQSIKKKQTKVLLGGLLSAFLVTTGGNLHALWWFLTHNFKFTGYWYPDATRFIVEKFGAADNTIHEFPLYSSVVSDLHGHFSDLPFVFLFLALLFALFVSKKGKKYPLYQILPIGLVLAVMYMTNSWDLPIYLIILGTGILFLNYQKYGPALKTILHTSLTTLSILLMALVFSLPFHLHFSQIAQGVAFVNSRSPLWQLLVLWGYQWFVVLSFLIFLASRRKIPRQKLPVGDFFILILVGVATVLIIIPEILYVKDIYIASHHRANTMFKLVYQSFTLYALASGYILVRIIANLKHFPLKFFYVFCLLPLLFFIFIYPYFAIKSYYGNLSSYQGLQKGLHFLEMESKNDSAGVDWLERSVLGQPVVLEAAGDSYTTFNRVSAITGLPTVQGWLVHEWLWRGAYDEPGKRASEVQTIYESKDLSQTEQLLKKYQVSYIFVGKKEREKYQVSEEKFDSLGLVVFSQGNTQIYFVGEGNNQSIGGFPAK